MKRALLYISPSVPDVENQVRYQRLVMLVDHFAVHAVTSSPIPLSLAARCASTTVVRGRARMLVRVLRIALALKESGTRRPECVVYTTPGPRFIVMGWLCKLFSRGRWVYDLFDHPSLMWSTDRTVARYLKTAAWMAFGRSAVKSADCWIIGMHPNILHHMPKPSSRCVLVFTCGPGWTSRAPGRGVCSKGIGKPREVVSVYAGPLTLERGVDHLAYIASHYVGRPVCLHLMGNEGPGVSEMLSRACTGASERGVRVIRHGWVDHVLVRATLEKADVGLCPLGAETLNYRYAYPVKVVEYLGYGLIVVATRGDGVCELLAHGVTGFVADPGPVSFLDNFERAVAVASDNSAREAFVASSVEKLGDRSWVAINAVLWQRLAAALEEIESSDSG